MGARLSKNKRNVHAERTSVSLKKSMAEPMPPSLFNATELYKADVLQEFQIIEGRRYHNVQGVHYFLPTPIDKAEEVRLNEMHTVWKTEWKENFSAPVRSRLAKGGARVLDVGCGSGVWLTECAKEFPGSTFVGVDVASDLPAARDKPENVGFLQYNIVDGLPFMDDTFDYVSERCVVSALTQHQFERLIDECIRVLKPGGWIEFMEMDAEFTDENFGGMPRNTKRFISGVHAYLRSKGTNPHIFQNMAPYFRENPKIIHVREEKRKIRVGAWGGSNGFLATKALCSGFLALKPVVGIFLGTTDTEYDKLIDRFCNESHEYNMWYNTYSVCCQKEN